MHTHMHFVLHRDTHGLSADAWFADLFALQVHGRIHTGAGNLRVMPPERSSRVSARLFVKTHFEQRQITLHRDMHEEDADATKHRLSPGMIEGQLQRAILYATSCLGSKNKELCTVGQAVLDDVEQLER